MSDEFDTDALRLEHPLSAYLPARGIDLKKSGREWKCACPLHQDKTASFTVYQGRKGHQLFKCFGCDEHGDVVDFVRAYDGVEFSEACRILGGEKSPPASRPERPALPEAADPYADWHAMPPPADAPPLVAGQRTPPIFNPKNDEKPVTSYKPVSVHAYRFASGKPYAYVLRVEIDGRKITPLIAWCRNEKTGQEGWSHYVLQAPRRLYGLQDLAARPQAPVVVVEGEKCADALAAALPSHVVVSWAGGGKAAAKSDWSPLAGRDVIIWPDADEEGTRTVEGWSGKPGLLDLIPAPARVARPAASAPKGWDCADAIADGWTGERCAAWLDGMGAVEQMRPTVQERPDMGIPITEQDQQVTPRPKPRPIPGTNVVAIAGGNVPGADHDWRADLEFDKHGQPEPKRPKNWFQFVRHHPKFVGMFALNTFTNTITVTRRPPWDRGTGAWTPRGLSDDDVTRCALELDKYETGNMQVSPEGMGRTISAAAEEQRFNPVSDYLRGLRWDGIHRLYGGDEQDGWLCHYFGAEPLTYHRTVGMRWLVAAAARALTEGAAVEKVDTMLILEGPQGFFKSTALEVLATINGQRLYTDSVEALTGKDAAMQTNGVLIVEVAELNGMGAKTVDAVKKWMSSKVDRYRPPYGKNVIEAPRRFVTAGTVNPSGPGYLHDATGARRFWPVACGKPCDLAALERDRDQLWAEAVRLFLQGEPWWLKPSEVPDAEYQQSLRYHDDPWAGRLDARMRESGCWELSLQDLFEAIAMPLHRAGSEDKRRISDHMKVRGWTMVRDGKGERWQKK